MGVTAKTCDAKLLVCRVVGEGGTATPTKAGLGATDGLVVLEVAVGEGVDKGRVGAEAGADELGGIGSRVWGEVLRTMG